MEKRAVVYDKEDALDGETVDCCSEAVISSQTCKLMPLYTPLPLHHNKANHNTILHPSSTAVTAYPSRPPSIIQLFCKACSPPRQVRSLVLDKT
jgi:hypothetical protein